VAVAHEHNLVAEPPAFKPYGIRVSLAPGHPFAHLIGEDWEKYHWFATERERDEWLAEMASRHRYSRRGDDPAVVYERVSREAVR
jgi:hypothetical protein